MLCVVLKSELVGLGSSCRALNDHWHRLLNDAIYFLHHNNIVLCVYLSYVVSLHALAMEGEWEGNIVRRVVLVVCLYVRSDAEIVLCLIHWSDHPTFVGRAANIELSVFLIHLLLFVYEINGLTICGSRHLVRISTVFVERLHCNVNANDSVYARALCLKVPKVATL